MTVSNAYNRPDQLSVATRERVLKAAAELGYPGPDPAGRSLRSRRAGAVGVLLSEALGYAFTDPGLVEFMRGVADELGGAGLAMLMVPAEADPDGSIVRSAIVDAFILCGIDENSAAVAAVVARRLPIVTAGSPKLAGTPFVGIDNRSAGQRMAEHLLELGHRQFGIVGRPSRDGRAGTWRGGAPRPGIRKRVDGFLQAITKAGLPAEAVTMVSADENTAESGAVAARVLCDGASGPVPTAIFAVTDVLALGVLEAMDSLGRSVPRDVSVAGFDDIVEASRSTPPLTTMAQSLYDQGVSAAKLAFGLITHEPVRAPRIVAELVVRGSTARVRDECTD
jgi:DNA-binding LacI/PurR family transcriptional regulator